MNVILCSFSSLRHSVESRKSFLSVQISLRAIFELFNYWNNFLWSSFMYLLLSMLRYIHFFHLAPNQCQISDERLPPSSLTLGKKGISNKCGGNCQVFWSRLNFHKNRSIISVKSLLASLKTEDTFHYVAQLIVHVTSTMTSLPYL